MSSDINELLEISKHLTEEYINQHLFKWFGCDLRYRQHSFGEESGKGDSYLSDVYRVTLYCKPPVPEPNRIKTSCVQLIIKAFPKSIGRRKTFRSQDFFKNEINFYLHILPELLEFQSKKSVINPFNSYPKLFAAITDGENDFLALEDLSHEGFKAAVRQEGLDYAHCQTAIEAFAKLHALSFAYKDQHPDKFEELKTKISETYCHPNHWDWYKGFWKRTCVCTIDAVSKEYPNTVYEKKVKEFATDQTYFRMSDAAIENGNTAVFSQGDSWTSNILFKYTTDKSFPLYAKIIDFQFARCASPILDLSIIIFSCTTPKMRKEYYDSMLKYYYNILFIHIKELGTDPDKVYPWSLYMEEIKKYSFFGAAFSFEAIPVLILDAADAFDVNSVQGDEVVNIADIWKTEPIETKAGRLRLAGTMIDVVDKELI